jgi:hypothetical protein
MAKFDELSPEYAEYFWDLHLNGESVEGSNNIHCVTIETEDTDIYPELVPGHIVRLWEDETGYVQCEVN